VTVTVTDIAVALGREEPDSGSVEARQWEMWVGDALMLIEARLGDPSKLNQLNLGYVVREAVVAQVRRPDDATSVEVAVDDGRVAKRYTSSRGRVFIRDEWWRLLDPNGKTGAFTVDLAGTANAVRHAVTCSLYFGATYCSCGADIAGFPIYGAS
jgi:hypothetical protein